MWFVSKGKLKKDKKKLARTESSAKAAMRKHKSKKYKKTSYRNTYA